MSARVGKEIFSPTLEYEGIIRGPDIVKYPQVLVNLEKYPARVVRENINCTLVYFNWLTAEPSHIFRRRGGEIPVEVGVLGEGETLLAFEMTEVPNDFWQHGRPSVATECLCRRIKIQ